MCVAVFVLQAQQEFPQDVFAEAPSEADLESLYDALRRQREGLEYITDILAYVVLFHCFEVVIYHLFVFLSAARISETCLSLERVCKTPLASEHTGCGIVHRND